MATIVQETGSGSASANSYVTEAELTTYATDRGITISGTNAVLIIQSMDFLEAKSFKGNKYTETQALQFPRSNLTIDGWFIDVDEIPTLLKEAQMEIALSIDGGTNPLDNLTRETKREKVGDLEVEYSSTARAATYLTAAETKLNKLVNNLSSNVYRG